LAQCAGVGCGLVRVVAGEERARKVFSLEGPPGDGETSRLGSRDPVDGGTRCGPHGGETKDEVVDNRVGARWRLSQEAWREAGPSTRGLVVCPQNHRRTVSWFGPQNQVRRPNATETGSGRVGKLRSGGHAAGSHGLCREDAGCGEGVAVRWQQNPQTLHKCPCVGCIAGS
jgi:hypothetical protein